MVKNIYEKGTKHEDIEHYDVLILGAGPAGLTAAIYTGRYHMSTAVVAKSIGGTANLAGELENWPGFIGPGMELMRKFKEQADKFGARFLESEVEHVEKDENGFVLHVKGKEIHGKTLIIALGTEHRKLNIKGEKELLGKGVSYCATCDGNFFKGKDVVIVGGADSAAKAALYLGDICAKVTIVYRREEIRCEPINLKKINEHKNIDVIYHATPLEIVGENRVEGVKIRIDDGEKVEEKELKVDGVFIEIGATPVVDIIEGLGLDVDCGYIKTDASAKTSVDGCFAAGDISNNNLKQVVTAAGEGAIAAKSAFDYLKLQED